MPSTSQYEVLHHFARKLYEAFVRTGASCRLLSGDERIYAALRSPPDFTIGFNGALKMEDGRLFCDHIKVPHVACLVDPPFRFLELTDSPYVIIACDDRIGCSLLKNRHFHRSVFMPHAVEKELASNLNAKRIYDLVLLGTCIDSGKRRKQWKRQFGVKVSGIMANAAEVALTEDEVSFISVLEEELDPGENQDVYEAVEMYIKGMDRLRLLQAFPERVIHVFGSSVDRGGWKKLLGSRSNMIVHPPVSYDQALEVMKQSKIVLNSSIKNKLGAHERIFTAAACGAVVVTNDNPLMREYFKAGKEILLYNGKKFEQLNLDVKELLDDEDKCRRMSMAGRERVLQGHTWDHRVKRLLQEITPMLRSI